MRELLEAVAGIKDDFQVIVITGNNASLHKELESLQPKLPYALSVLGYVRNVHEIMSAADVLISKPGGMTAAEALCRELPIILYSPIPGQEEANAKFFYDKGAALCAHSAADAVKHVQSLLFERDNKLRASLTKNIRTLKRPLAADDIAKAVLSESFP